ncbi:MAG: DUF1553 domain-containing protein [Planctomycetota bacterium]|nr:DUF1553 domain-containing protein [Planctomycetota bacterium]
MKYDSEDNVTATLILYCLLGQASRADDAFFEMKVRPLLAAKCFSCHGPDEQEGGLRLDSAASFRKGGDSGPVVKAKDVDGSLLVRAIRRTTDLKMPPDKPLSPAQIKLLVQWVRSGAVWPEYDTPPATVAAEQVDAVFSEEELAFWAFQPVRLPALPVVNTADLVRTPIDRFIVARRKKDAIHGTPCADQRTLIRRLHYDLLGLPPPPEVVDNFVNDPAPDSYSRLVDRLLTSPHYGERWGRHWLDVVRYADTTANDGNYIMRYAYRYRDYVINAFNADKPYNQFVIEQIAGDLLPEDGDREAIEQQTIATGFLLLGPKALAEQDKELLLFDIVDEQIDVTSRAFLAMTVACSRCHDHKFDPIPTADYYSWAGVFRSTRNLSDTEFVSKWMERPLNPDGTKAMFQVKPAAGQNLARHGTARQSTENAGNFPASRAIDGVPDNFSHTADGDASPWWEVTLAVDSPISLIGLWNRKDCCATRLSNFRVSVLDASRKPVFRQDFFKDGKDYPPADQGFYIRVPDGRVGRTVRVELLGPNATGEHWLQLAEVEIYADRSAPLPLDTRMVMAVEEGQPRDVPIHRRGSYKRPGVMAPRRFLQIIDGAGHAAFKTSGSGRLELAHRIARAGNPLVSRVIVNRIWQGHFGTGLVATSDNFGQLGQRPSHPGLLDWLASECVQSAWSLKHLHRLILNSAVYQQSSRPQQTTRQSIDPENRLLWKFPRRRLTAEELRDSLLVLGGKLDPALGGSTLDVTQDGGKEDEKRGLYSAAAPAGEFKSYASRRRSIYLPVLRNTLHEVFQLFDFANANAVTTRRQETTVAPQSLYLMNSPFVREQADSMAAWLLGRSDADDQQRLRLAHRLVLLRQPSDDELQEALQYVTETERQRSVNEPDNTARRAAWSGYCRLLMSLNEFMYVD